MNPIRYSIHKIGTGEHPWRLQYTERLAHRWKTAGIYRTHAAAVEAMDRRERAVATELAELTGANR